jgi:hypothetical protein
MDKVCLSNDNFNKLLELSLKNCYINKKNDTVRISQPQNSIKFKPHSFVQINTPNCPPKYYNYNGDCKPCPYGSYSSPDQTYCIPGIKNTNPTVFDPASGTFKNCPKNSYKESSISNNCICNGSPISLDETCVSVDQKNAGKFLDRSGQLKDCPDGTLSSPNNTYCISKIGGQTFDVKSGVFQPCPDGTYKLSSDISNTCQKCPDGTLSSSDKTYCISKSGGQIFNTQTGYMVDCPSFSYKFSSDTSNTCQDCPNHTNSSDDRTYCISNKPGQFFDIDGQFKDCPNGTYKGPLNKCESCPKGSNSSSDRTYCTLPYPNNGGKIFDIQSGQFQDCPKDTYKESSSISKSNICKNCPPYSYPSSDKTRCISKTKDDNRYFYTQANVFQPCPDNSYLSKDKLYCISSRGGQIFNVEDGGFQPCPVRSYKRPSETSSTPDSNICEPCPTADTTGMNFCCPPGSKTSENKKYCIKDNPVGGEVYNTYTNTFVKCPKDTYYSKDHTDNICKPCIGAYFPTEDQSSCNITADSKISDVLRRYGIPEFTKYILDIIPEGNRIKEALALSIEPTIRKIEGTNMTVNQVKEIVDLNKSGKLTKEDLGKIGIDIAALGVLAKSAGMTVESFCEFLGFVLKVFEIFEIFA